MGWSEAETAASIPERFERQVKLRPDQVAIASASGPVSYAELNAVADRYAAAILRGTPSDPAGPRRAALLLSSDSDVITAALAALKCGFAVVTLNPHDPPARLAQIQAEVEAHVLITDEVQSERAGGAGFADDHTVVLEAIPAADGDPYAGAAPQPDDLAFLICTSGSSGRPKVVMQSHRNVLHNVLRYTNGLQIAATDRVALMAWLSGGQGLATTWTTLLNGATLCPFPIADRGVTGLASWMEVNEVTVLDTIPSVLRNFALTLHGERIAGVRLVRLASEGALHGDFDAFKRHFTPDCVLASVLASSEAGVIAQGILSSDDDIADGRLPVGRPAEGIEVVLVGEGGKPVTNGELGEIVVQGRYLSLGYWRDEALTAERFAPTDRGRRFRTGDMAIRSPTGVLTVVGRADQQVKVRGHRLQLEEVEAAVAAHPDVAAVAVVLRSTARGDARLTAFITPAQDQTPSAAELRRSLRHVLAPHAIPAAFVTVAAMPLNAHGKVDREQLAEAEPDAVTDLGEQPPASETEELVAALWADAFERDAVELAETFLELGGDSLLAAQIAAGVHDVFGVDLDLRVFAADPTIATLATLVDQRRGSAGEDDLPRLARIGRIGPLSFAQTRFWPESNFDEDPRQHVVMPFRIRGPLDVEAMRQSVELIVQRHEILRTTFEPYDGRPMAVVRPPGPVALTFDDLRGTPDQSARVSEIIESALVEPYDLQRGPLFRLRLLRLGDEHYQLLRLSHHLIHDAASWKIFFTELGMFYEALIDGTTPTLQGEPALQYLDYAVWERTCVNSASRRRAAEKAWWERTLDAPPAVLKLPFTRPEPEPDAPVAQPIWWGLPADHSAALDGIGRASGATFFMTRLALFSALLAIETGAHDFIIGTPVSTRTRSELQGMFGPLINFTPMRFGFEGAPSFYDWLAEVRRVVIDTTAHASVPWEVLRTELLAAGIKLRRFSAMFVPSAGIEPMSFGGIELAPLRRPCPPSRVPFLRLGVNRPFETDRCWAEFDTRIHDPAGVESFLSRLRALAAGVSAHPEGSLHDLHAAVSLV